MLDKRSASAVGFAAVIGISPAIAAGAAAIRLGGSGLSGTLSSNPVIRQQQLLCDPASIQGGSLTVIYDPQIVYFAGAMDVAPYHVTQVATGGATAPNEVEVAFQSMTGQAQPGDQNVFALLFQYNGAAGVAHYNVVAQSPPNALMPSGDYLVASDEQGTFTVPPSNITPVTVSGALLIGDANGDGTVNFSDVLTLIQHYGQTGQTWVDGDFNADSSVNFTDVLALIQHYGQSVAGVANASPAPEPGAALLPAAGLLLARRRRRHAL